MSLRRHGNASISELAVQRNLRPPRSCPPLGTVQVSSHVVPGVVENPHRNGENNVSLAQGEIFSMTCCVTAGLGIGNFQKNKGSLRQFSLKFCIQPNTIPVHQMEELQGSLARPKHSFQERHMPCCQRLVDEAHMRS